MVSHQFMRGTPPPSPGGVNAPPRVTWGRSTVHGWASPGSCIPKRKHPAHRPVEGSSRVHGGASGLTCLDIARKCLDICWEVAASTAVLVQHTVHRAIAHRKE